MTNEISTLVCSDLVHYFLCQRGLEDISSQHEVQVEPSAGVGRWKISNHDKNELYRVR